MKKQEDFVTPRYLTYKSTARYMGMSEASIRRYKDSGDLLFIKSGSNVLFDREDIDSFMGKQKVIGQKNVALLDDIDDLDVDNEVAQILGV